MKSLLSRARTLAITTAIVVAQVIMPVQSAFAYTTNPVENPSYNSKSYVCKMVGKPGENERLQTGNNPIQVDRKSDDVIGTQFTDAHDNSYIVGFGYPSEPQDAQPNVDNCARLLVPTPAISVTPCTPGTATTDTVTVTMTNNDSVTGNTAVYEVTIGTLTQSTMALTDGQSQTLTFANLATGTYNISVSAFGRIVYTGQVVVDACTTPERIANPTISLKGVCSPGNDVVTPSTSPDYTASQPSWNGSVVSVTFTIKDGVNKVFAENGQKSITVTANEVNTDSCESSPERIPTPSVEVVGVCGVANDTLKYTAETTDYTSNASWNQAHTSATVTFTIKNGINKVFASTGTKSATVTVNEADTSRCPAAPCSAKSNVYLQPWTFNGKQYPSAGASPSGAGKVPGTFEFTNNAMFTGLHLTTLNVESYVNGFIDAGNTNLRDVDALSYTTYRVPMEARSRQTLPAYILSIDKDGDLTTSDKTIFWYEPYYNDTVNEGEWRTWDALDGGNALWYISGTGQARRTWQSLVTEFPNAKVISYGFNQGTYNEGADTYIKSMTFDCATTTFSAPGRGSAGGETPTTPTTPTTPSIPVVETPAQPTPGKGATLPAELPETGASANYLAISVLLSVIAYGAVYFAQGKRQYE
jgi:hypothetical protein